MAKIVERFKNQTFALVCQTRVERDEADNLNLSLTRNDNLRIIDISAAWAECLDDAPNVPDNFLFSLMYLLSSADFVLSLSLLPGEIGDMLELRAEAALCAAAGLPLITVLRHDSRQRHGAKPLRGIHPSPVISDMLSAFTDAVFPIPHLFQIDEEEILAETGRLGELFNLSALGLDNRIFDQWLIEDSLGKTGQIIENLLLA